MLYSQETVYAIRIVEALKNGEQRALKEICQTQKVPVSWGYKIAKKLNQTGFLTVKHGRYGGYRLGRDLESYTFGEFILNMEPNLEICTCVHRACPFDKEKESCALYQEVMRLQEKMLEHLGERTMSQVLNGSEVFSAAV